MLLMMVVSIFFCFSLSTFASTTTYEEISEADRLTNLVNMVRKRTRLPLLSHCKRLDELAKYKSIMMQETGHFEHYHPNLPSVGSLLDSSGFRWKIAGENLALNYLNPEEAIEGWMQSKSHRNNILEPDFNAHGSCRVGRYYTQLFSRFE